MGAITVKYITTKSVFVALLFFFVTKPEHLIYVPLLTLAGELVSIALTWYYIINKLKLKLVKVSFQDVFSQTAKSSTYFFSRIATTVYSATNVFILGLYYTATVGIYGIANTIASTIKGMYGPISDSLYPYMVTNKNFKVLKIVLLVFIPLIAIGCIVLYYLSDFVIILISGNDYIYAAKLLRYMIPMLLITFPSYVLGFPTLGALGYTNKANSSVLWASLFHAIGLTFLMISKKVTMENVIILTSITELIILILRIFWIIVAKRAIKEIKAVSINDL